MKSLDAFEGYRKEIDKQFLGFLVKLNFYSIPINGIDFIVCVSRDVDGEYAWEHVSVSPKNEKRCPSWEEMDCVKRMFFNDDEIVIQFHPKEEDYVNLDNWTLHLWRPDFEFPFPERGAKVVDIDKGGQFKNANEDILFVRLYEYGCWDLAKVSVFKNLVKDQRYPEWLEMSSIKRFIFENNLAMQFHFSNEYFKKDPLLELYLWRLKEGIKLPLPTKGMVVGLNIKKRE